MTHYTLIDGTAKTITGGKTLIDGTMKTIASGKALIGGTAEDIVFATKELTLPALMATATLARSAGRNNSSSSTVSIAKTNVPVGTSYLFSFCDGYMSIYKVTRTSSSANATISRLRYTNTDIGNARVSSGVIYYSDKGDSSSTSVHGATLALLTFSGYTEAETDAILGAVTLEHIAGRNSTSGNVTALISTPSLVSQTSYFFAAYSTYMGFSKLVQTNSSGTITNIFGNHTSRPSLLLYKSNSNTYNLGLATSSSLLNCYGGSIVRAS